MDTAEKTKLRYEELLTLHVENIREALDSSLDRCESPIEAALLTELYWMDFGYSSTPNPLFNPPKEASDYDFIFGGLDDLHVAIMPQAKWQKYRIDFAVFAQGPNRSSRLLLAIECDGHDYHERTKEQAARDKSRDRAFLLGGWQTMRFTGAEIYKDAENCAIDVMKFVSRWLEGAIESYLEGLRR